jgi:hypothetical protein
MAIGFKEWALVCDALAAGKQSVIIRKGGIHEGRDGFRFEHPEFFLFPTLFHEQVERLKVPRDTPIPPRPQGVVPIRAFARVEWTRWVGDLEVVRALAPFHLWADAVIEERFNYDEPPGVHVAWLRVYRLAAPWDLADSPLFGGCRSWVDLPDGPPFEAVLPATGDAEHAALEAEVRRILG